MGAGFSGTVFDTGKRVVKVEKMFINTDTDIEAADAGKVAQLMGSLGVGPKVHSWRVCESKTLGKPISPRQ